ncbi:MAG: hypothetical protein IE887_09405 [Campylobacterales bacterium]|nr:hypothetical protein [Campylobacterales bacterium]
MTYTYWFSEHSNKHKTIVNSLKYLEKKEIIKYFEYENMQSLHKDFCYLFEQNTKCHDIKNLNCYLCGCPYFRFDDDGLYIDDKGNTVYSYCVKNLGCKFTLNGETHHDCSKCTIPHTKKFISDNFDMDWSMIMKDVIKP